VQYRKNFDLAIIKAPPTWRKVLFICLSLSDFSLKSIVSGNSSTQKVEAGGSQVLGQPGPHREGDPVSNTHTHTHTHTHTQNYYKL
jgi:hypothetical protein